MNTENRSSGLYPDISRDEDHDARQVCVAISSIFSSTNELNSLPCRERKGYPRDEHQSNEDEASVFSGREECLDRPEVE